MKVAIASNDGINISKDFFKSNSYKVFTLDQGKVVKEEFRKIDSVSEEEICKAISDCNFFIINNYEQLCDDIFGEDEDKAFVKTEEIMITNIIHDFSQEQKRIEANYLCCP